jgi:hypothetical protein
MLLTRLVGLACQKSALNKMVVLHSRTDDHGKAQAARQCLQDLEIEAQELRRVARQAGQG